MCFLPDCVQIKIYNSRALGFLHDCVIFCAAILVLNLVCVLLNVHDSIGRFDDRFCQFLKHFVRVLKYQNNFRRDPTRFFF